MNNSTTKNSLARNLTSAGLLLAIGLILPHFFTAFGREMGTIFSPMDLTVLLGGLILGWRVWTSSRYYYPYDIYLFNRYATIPNCLNYVIPIRSNGTYNWVT